MAELRGFRGVFSRTLLETKKSAWQICFLLGLIIGPLFVWPFGFHLPHDISVSWWHILFGGFFVGLGSKLGSGCTSGHGICGIGRGSVRSIVATVIFMLSAFLTVWIFH